MTEDLFTKDQTIIDKNNLNSNDEKNFSKEKNSDKNLTKKILKMSFEEAMTRLDNIVEILSSQKNNLEEMITLYEEANLLKEHCETRLNDAKMKIENINKNN